MLIYNQKSYTKFLTDKNYIILYSDSSGIVKMEKVNAEKTLEENRAILSELKEVSFKGENPQLVENFYAQLKTEQNYFHRLHPTTWLAGVKLFGWGNIRFEQGIDKKTFPNDGCSVHTQPDLRIKFPARYKECMYFTSAQYEGLQFFHGIICSVEETGTREHAAFNPIEVTLDFAREGDGRLNQWFTFGDKTKLNKIQSFKVTDENIMFEHEQKNWIILNVEHPLQDDKYAC